MHMWWYMIARLDAILRMFQYDNWVQTKHGRRFKAGGFVEYVMTCYELWLTLVFLSQPLASRWVSKLADEREVDPGSDACACCLWLCTMLFSRLRDVVAKPASQAFLHFGICKKHYSSAVKFSRIDFLQMSPYLWETHLAACLPACFFLDGVLPSPAAWLACWPFWPVLSQ